jgi:hypothetical protein
VLSPFVGVDVAVMVIVVAAADVSALEAVFAGSSWAQASSPVVTTAMSP